MRGDSCGEVVWDYEVSFEQLLHIFKLCLHRGEDDSEMVVEWLSVACTHTHTRHTHTTHTHARTQHDYT